MEHTFNDGEIFFVEENVKPTVLPVIAPRMLSKHIRNIAIFHECETNKAYYYNGAIFFAKKYEKFYIRIT